MKLLFIEYCILRKLFYKKTGEKDWLVASSCNKVYFWIGKQKMQFQCLFHTVKENQFKA
jgi:hypothetical protein